jgi:hypothetical protein
VGINTVLPVYKNNIFKNQVMDLFCKIIVDESYYLSPSDFRFCVMQVINYICTNININNNTNNTNNNTDNTDNNSIDNYYQLNYLSDFMAYIGKLYHKKVKACKCEIPIYPKYDIEYDKEYNKEKLDKYFNDLKKSIKCAFKVQLFDLLKSNECTVSQLFMELMDFHYYKYLKIKFTPDPPGTGYKKTKKHFKLMAKKGKNEKNKITNE